MTLYSWTYTMFPTPKLAELERLAVRLKGGFDIGVLERENPPGEYRCVFRTRTADRDSGDRNPRRHLCHGK